MQPCLQTASRQEPFFIVAKLYLAAMRMSTKCEVYTQPGCFAKDYGVMREQELHFIRI